MKYSDGRIYTGSWDDNSKNGEGEMIYPDGTIYRGNFINNLRHGRGILIKYEYE